MNRWEMIAPWLVTFAFGMGVFAVFWPRSWKRRRVSASTRLSASYAWFNQTLICGQCHYAMDSSVSKNDIPVEYRTKCVNPRCVNFGKLFKVDTRSSVRLEEIGNVQR